MKSFGTWNEKTPKFCLLLVFLDFLERNNFSSLKRHKKYFAFKKFCSSNKVLRSLLGENSPNPSTAEKSKIFLLVQKNKQQTFTINFNQKIKTLLFKIKFATLQNQISHLLGDKNLIKHLKNSKNVLKHS